MHKNWETLDVDKIQERWYVHPLCTLNLLAHEVWTGAVVTNPGYLENAGRSCLKIFATSSRKSSTHLAFPNSTTLLNIAPCTTARSFSQYLTNMETD